MEPLELPILRRGQVYRSLDTAQQGAALVDIANPGLIRRDALTPSDALRAVSASELAAALLEAGRLFESAALPLSLAGGAPELSPASYQELVAATTGLTPRLVREQAEMIGQALTVLAGFAPEPPADVAPALGVVLPSNAPATNRVWLPALLRRSAVALKPGSGDPWTPWRLVVALTRAGLPAEAFGVYPATHAGADAVVESWPRVLLFGDRTVADRYAAEPHVAVHGPGHSKVIVGPDRAADFGDFVDVLAQAVSDVGGRSCLCASTVVTPTHADGMAVAVAAALEALPDDALGSFADPARPAAIDEAIRAALQVPGAAVVTEGQRLVQRGDRWVLRPTVVRCIDPAHPLAQREFGFPFVAVVELPAPAISQWLAPTLAASIISEDVAFVASLRGSGRIERVVVGAVPPSRGASMALHLANMTRLLS